MISVHFLVAIVDQINCSWQCIEYFDVLFFKRGAVDAALIFASEEELDESLFWIIGDFLSYCNCSQYCEQQSSNHLLAVKNVRFETNACQQEILISEWSSFLQIQPKLLTRCLSLSHLTIYTYISKLFWLCQDHDSSMMTFHGICKMRSLAAQAISQTYI